MSDTPETILAFDFGLRRIGVAVGQQVTASASPLGVVGNGDEGPDWAAIARLIDEWRPARIVVGLPLHADGTASEISQQAQAFADECARFDLPVETEDERYTSAEAAGILQAERAAGKRRRVNKETIDSAAATLIAERWLARN